MQCCFTYEGTIDVIVHLCVFYFFRCLDRTEEKGETNHLSGLLFLFVWKCACLLCVFNL